MHSLPRSKSQFLGWNVSQLTEDQSVTEIGILKHGLRITGISPTVLAHTCYNRRDLSTSICPHISLLHLSIFMTADSRLRAITLHLG